MTPSLRGFSLLFLCAGCASIDVPSASPAQAAQHWVGRTEAELVAAKGEPSRTLSRVYEDGTLIEKTLEYTGAAAMSNAPQAANLKRPALINGQWVLLPDDSVINSGKAAAHCKLAFKVDAGRIVRSWQAEGPGCNY